MSAIQANLRNDMDHSCNWKCCFGCKDPEPEVVPPAPRPTPVDVTAEVTDLAAAHALHRTVSSHHRIGDGYDMEFDAVHINVKRSPEHSEAERDIE